MGYGNGGSDFDARTMMEKRAIQAIGSTSGTQAPPPRIPAVPSELQRMHENADRLHALVSDLESHISSVLRQEPTTNQATAVDRAPHSVMLAGGLSELNGRFESVAYRLHAMLERIEL